MKTILCFGDSNTYGYKPDGSGRFEETIRWTGIIRQKLGEGYRVIEEVLLIKWICQTNAGPLPSH